MNRSEGRTGVTERRKPTTTSNFGVGKRESHDASAFYARFAAPAVDRETKPARPDVVDEIFCGDSRSMTRIADRSVALVVTSPPYFAGKAYEEALGEGHIPASYLEYLQMLEDVFAECVRTLEPGGRIAVNIANLGRKPYRSLSADVTMILQDRLQLLLRGEVIWKKADGAAGSCAWGSFQSAANPVLRDLTERVVIASKGRFDRAIDRPVRARDDWPSENSLTKEEFMEATTDLWEIAPESATRVGHPAPFPVALPQRLIELYTYRGDLVLDPFMGSGSTAVASLRTGRHYVGYDTDEEYVLAATARAAQEQGALAAGKGRRARNGRSVHGDAPRLAAAIDAGEKVRDLAVALLVDCGFTDVRDDKRRGAVAVATLTARDALGHDWYFDVSGTATVSPNGLRRTDTLWKTLGKAAVLHDELGDTARFVLLSTELPGSSSAAGSALRSAKRSKLIIDAVSVYDAGTGRASLREYARGETVAPGAGRPADRPARHTD
jgi:site-specific DNA-methyltransferase (adenine-specific)